MDRWDAVPETYQDYIRLCKLSVRRNLPSEIREAATREFGEDLDQEVLALAWEAFQKRLTVRVAGRLFRNGIYALVRGIGGWKQGFVKAERRKYWARVVFSNVRSSADFSNDLMTGTVWRSLGMYRRR